MDHSDDLRTEAARLAGPVPPRQHSQSRDMVDLIVAIVKTTTGRSLPRGTAKRLYQAMVEHMLRTTATLGYWRLPSGWGSFTLKILGRGAKPRRLPDGEYVQRRPRPYVRYIQGSVVRHLMSSQAPWEYRRKRKFRLIVDRILGETDKPGDRGV